jgi:hypothetical protein
LPHPRPRRHHHYRYPPLPRWLFLLRLEVKAKKKSKNENKPEGLFAMGFKSTVESKEDKETHIAAVDEERKAEQKKREERKAQKEAERALLDVIPDNEGNLRVAMEDSDGDGEGGDIICNHYSHLL